jgi:hypothetical protein
MFVPRGPMARIVSAQFWRRHCLFRFGALRAVCAHDPRANKTRQPRDGFALYPPAVK